jgi:hypothetical protein
MISQKVVNLLFRKIVFRVAFSWVGFDEDQQLMLVHKNRTLFGMKELFLDKRPYVPLSY